MKLDKITLKNFRCYSRLEVDLNQEMTVLVANNGQGKTSILDAIRVALWPFVSQFDLANTAYKDPANTITIDDVTIKKAIKSPSTAGFGVLDEMVRKFPSSVSAIGDYGQGKVEWQRFRDSEAVKSQTKDDKHCRNLKAFAKDLQRRVREDEQESITLPVFGYYGTGRLWKEKRLTESKRGQNTNDENIRTFALRDSLDPASSYRQFEDWFTDAYKKVLEHQIAQLQQGATFIEVDPKLKIPVKVVQSAVNEVLKPVGWKNLQFSQRDDESLVLRHDEFGVMKADRLSDGIKNMLAMVADIAYRCVLLNGHLGENAAKESPGIVMIDEVDMHLHPQWQQTVIGSLREAFPNIQFIVTTHSPQVLSTVSANCIRVLRHGIDPETGEMISIAEQRENQTIGISSSDILVDYQDVNPIPPIKEADWLSEYIALIEMGSHDSTEGKLLRKKLIAIYGQSHRVLLDADKLIRFQKFKSKAVKG
ncbi:AAA family ATPase [Photobacterium swingsii]|uniref:AAA family ATPase n=1 Tax=Photobacterium swingsii TaxID=680026 RepID=UPI004067F90C